MLQGPVETAFVQVGGNLLVFAALGAMLPVRSARFAHSPGSRAWRPPPRSPSSSSSMACASAG